MLLNTLVYMISGHGILVQCWGGAQAPQFLPSILTPMG